MMEGFGVHTFRFINADGISSFVKFHWKPLLGVHSVAWDEAQNISGKDPDFHRRDLWESIESGNFPEYELGVQIVPEEDEHKFEFDLLDPTKLIPEELVPVQRIGKLTLNKNPDNFFAETEQVAFHPGHIVPGIDFSNDPLPQYTKAAFLNNTETETPVFVRFSTVAVPLLPFTGTRLGAISFGIAPSADNFFFKFSTVLSLKPFAISTATCLVAIVFLIVAAILKAGEVSTDNFTFNDW